MSDIDAANDRRRLAAEKDSLTAIQVGELRGTVSTRLGYIEESIKEAKEAVRDTKVEINARIDKSDETVNARIERAH